MGKYYKEYGEMLRDRFGAKMQKLSVDAGFSCPNRDGSIGRNGCIYCNNTSFSPAVAGEAVSARSLPVADQLEAGKRFFEHKYPDMRYLAYFQSYTNTYGDPDQLIALYRQALSVDKVDGLIIGTRPDCVPDPLLHAIAALERPVIMEYGAETSHDSTLAAINRCHTWQQTVDAVHRTVDAGLSVGLHLIMGLPGETEEMMMQTIDRVAAIPIDSLKLHQLQVIDHTPLSRLWRENPSLLHLFEVDEYVALCARIVRVLQDKAPHIALDRFTAQAPADLLLAPRWGLKNYQFVNLLHRELSR